MSATPILDVRHLSTSFDTPRGRLQAVDDVSFSLAPGETLGIVGESGSGKSVTVLSVLGLFSPTTRATVTGSAMFDGAELLGASERQLCQIRGREIGMVFQDPLTALDPVMPIGEQVAEVIRRHERITRDAARRRAIELLERVGIPEPHRRADELPSRFSGGMRQRVVIAMAIACQPKVLIADEPTTALDVTVQAQILRLLNRLQDELGMGMVMITHDLGVVAATCDSVQVMYAGRIAEQGLVGHILDSPHHPYSQGLIRLIPRLDQERHHRMRPIPGSPLTVLDDHAGCRFAPRCEHRMPKCEADAPPSFRLGPKHSSECWLDEAAARMQGQPTAAALVEETP